MKIKRNQKGFTLIEVVLVLAIGGLIFLLAFLAFQQVSVNRRDTQRRSDASKLVAELQNFKGDQNGFPADITSGTVIAPIAAGGAVTPATAKTFIDSYMGGASFKNPNGVTYGTVASTLTPATDQVTYRTGYKCNDTGTGITASSGNVAVQVGLEKGIICRDDE